MTRRRIAGRHVKPLPGARDHVGCVAHAGAIHVIGGRFNTFEYNTDLHHIYLPDRDTWEARAPLPTARSGHGLVVYRNRLFAMGGEGGILTGGVPRQAKVFGQMESYDPVSDTWQHHAPMPTPRHAVGAVDDRRLDLCGRWRRGPRRLGAVCRARSLHAGVMLCATLPPMVILRSQWYAIPDPTRTGPAAPISALLSRPGRGPAVARNRRPAAFPGGCRRPPATDDGARAPVGTMAAGDPGQERSSSQAADEAGRALRPPSGNGPHRCSSSWLIRRHPGLQPLCGIGSGRFRRPPPTTIIVRSPSNRSGSQLWWGTTPDMFEDQPL